MSSSRRLALVLAGLMAAIVLPAGASAATIQATEVTSMQALYGVACVSSSTCYAVGADSNDNPAVLTLTNGNPGAVTDFSDANFEPAGIACPSASQCLVVGNDVDEDAGEEVGAVVPVTNGNPGATQEVSSTSALLAIGCSSYAYCIAAGQDQSDDFGTVEISGGQAGNFTEITDANFGGSAVACYSTNKCIVAGEDGLPPDSTGAISLVTGGTPAATTSTNDAIEFSAVACTASGSCDGVGNVNGGNDSDGYPIPDPSVNAIDDGAFGASWDYSQYSDGAMAAAACASASTCVAVGNDDNGDLFAVPINGGNAGSAEALQTSSSIGQIQLADIACPASDSCVAIGQDGYTNPVVAVVPVPGYQAQTPTTGSPSPGTGSGSGGSGPTTGTHHRTPIHLTLSVAWSRVHPTRLQFTVLCRSTALTGVNGVKVRLEELRVGARGKWRVLARAVTRNVRQASGEARLDPGVALNVHVRYRAVVEASRSVTGAISNTKTIIVYGKS